MNLNGIGILCFDDNTIEFLLADKKQGIIKPEYIAKYEYSNFKELLELTNKLITESKSKFIKIIYAGSELIDSVYFLKANEQNISGEIYKGLKKDFDIDLQNYLIDYAIFEDEVEPDIAIYACCFPKTFRDMFENLKSKVKLLTSYSDIYAQSLFYEECDETTLFLNIRTKNTTLVIKKGEAILMTRGVNVGFEQILEQIANEGGVIDMEKVKNFLSEIGVEDFEDEEKKQISDTIKNSMDRISLETQRTIDYYNRYIKKEEIKKIVITGKTGYIKGITKYFSQLFGIPVETIEPLNNIEDTGYEMESFDFIAELIGAYYEL